MCKPTLFCSPLATSEPIWLCPEEHKFEVEEKEEKTNFCCIYIDTIAKQSLQLDILSHYLFLCQLAPSHVVPFKSLIVVC